MERPPPLRLKLRVVGLLHLIILLGGPVSGSDSFLPFKLHISVSLVENVKTPIYISMSMGVKYFFFKHNL